MDMLKGGIQAKGVIPDILKTDGMKAAEKMSYRKAERAKKEESVRQQVNQSIEDRTSGNVHDNASNASKAGVVWKTALSAVSEQTKKGFEATGLNVAASKGFEAVGFGDDEERRRKRDILMEKTSEATDKALEASKIAGRFINTLAHKTVDGTLAVSKAAVDKENWKAAGQAAVDGTLAATKAAMEGTLDATMGLVHLGVDATMDGFAQIDYFGVGQLLGARGEKIDGALLELVLSLPALLAQKYKSTNTDTGGAAWQDESTWQSWSRLHAARLAKEAAGEIDDTDESGQPACCAGTTVPNFTH
jgi:hypothetical protein